MKKHPTKYEKSYAKRMGVSVDTIWQIEHSSTILFRVHSPLNCVDEVCVLHNMTDHSMRSFKQHWRSDRAIMERTCPHGVGHPDPDMVPFWKRTRPGKWEYEMVHGCDGCCRPNSKIYQDNYGE